MGNSGGSGDGQTSKTFHHSPAWRGTWCGNLAKGWRVARVPDSSFHQNLLCEYIFSKLYLVYMPKERSKEAGSQESGAEVREMSSSSSSILLAPAFPAQISSKVDKLYDSYTSLTGTEATTCVESLSNLASTSFGEGSVTSIHTILFSK